MSKTKVTLAGVEKFHRAVPLCGITSDFGVTQPHFASVAATIPAASVSGPINFVAEREAAEWILANDGSISVELAAGTAAERWLNLKAPGALPKERFVVRIIDVRDGQVKSDEDLTRLARCQFLGDLNITSGNGSDRAVELLARLPRVSRLGLAYHKSLRTSGLHGLGRIPTLSQLDITPEMVDDQLEFVRHLPQLRTLVIFGPNPPDISSLAEASQLRTILLQTPDAVDDDKLAAVQARHGKLRIVVGWEKFRVVGHDPAHAAAAHLVKLGVECYGGRNYVEGRTKMLTPTDLEDGSVWSFEVRKVPATVQLSAPDGDILTFLEMNHFTAERQHEANTLAKSLSQNHQLNSVTMQDCDLTDAGLEHLHKLVGLRSLALLSTNVTKEGIQRLHRAIPDTYIYSDFGEFLQDYRVRAAATPSQ